MGLLTFRQYGVNNGITYQAVRKLYINHEDELKDLVITQGGTKFLTDEAQEKLDSFRKGSPIIVVEDNIKELQCKIEERDNVIKDLQAKIISVYEDRDELLAIKTKYEALLEDKKSIDLEKQRQADELKELKTKLEGAEAVKASYKKTFFGLYRKEKA